MLRRKGEHINFNLCSQHCAMKTYTRITFAVHLRYCENLVERAMNCCAAPLSIAIYELSKFASPEKILAQ